MVTDRDRPESFLRNHLATTRNEQNELAESVCLKNKAKPTLGRNNPALFGTVPYSIALNLVYSYFPMMDIWFQKHIIKPDQPNSKKIDRNALATCQRYTKDPQN